MGDLGEVEKKLDAEIKRVSDLISNLEAWAESQRTLLRRSLKRFLAEGELPISDAHGLMEVLKDYDNQTPATFAKWLETVEPLAGK